MARPTEHTRAQILRNRGPQDREVIMTGSFGECVRLLEKVMPLIEDGEVWIETDDGCVAARFVPGKKKRRH